MIFPGTLHHSASIRGFMYQVPDAIYRLRADSIMVFPVEDDEKCGKHRNPELLEDLIIVLISYQSVFLQC